MTTATGPSGPPSSSSDVTRTCLDATAGTPAPAPDHQRYANAPGSWRVPAGAGGKRGRGPGTLRTDRRPAGSGHGRRCLLDPRAPSRSDPRRGGRPRAPRRGPPGAWLARPYRRRPGCQPGWVPGRPRARRDCRAVCDGDTIPRPPEVAPMTDSQETEVSEAQIAVHWREEEYYQPPPAFVAQANANDPAIFDRFTEDKFPGCFTEYADLLTWDRRWDTVLDTSSPPFWKWFVGGRLNACYNCVDRHAQADPGKTAVIFVPELESDEVVRVSYGDLLRQVSEFAALLRDFCGLRAGDRVTLHMPMVPELPVVMLACARLGVIHSQVFAGFSGHACGTRIADSGSRVLITMDGYYRA